MIKEILIKGGLTIAALLLAEAVLGKLERDWLEEENNDVDNEQYESEVKSEESEEEEVA